MEIYQAMAARKTIRDFRDQEVDPQLVNKLISAGLLALTNNHLREWHFVLLSDKARRKELLDRVIHPVDESGATQIIDKWGLKDQDQREMYIDGIPKQYGMLYNAGCLILPWF